MADAAITQQNDAVEYGQQAQIDAQAASMPAPAPAIDPAAIAQAVAAEAPVAQDAQQGYTIKNPYMLLPAKMNFGQFQGQGQKTQVEQKYDVGIMFDAISANDPAMRVIADELMGKS
jgi:hypothetical protein